MYKLHGKHNNTIVLHGGPGAIGSASGLSKVIGNCVELYSYGKSISKQIEEISNVVTQFKMQAVTLVGHSWGAWLAYIYATQHKIKKVILIGSGPFEEQYLKVLSEKRNDSLTASEQVEVQKFFQKLASGEVIEDMAHFGKLMTKMDSYALEDYSDELMEFDFEGHQSLMDELRNLRKSGQLLAMGKQLKCDLVVMHGLNDPHPLKGIIEPFNAIGLKHKLYSYEKCGHTPWNEKFASESFKTDLNKELSYAFESERLRFRNLNWMDRDFFYAMNSNPEVMRYFPNVLTRETSDAFLKKIMLSYDESGYGLYCVESKINNEPIGFIGLSKPTFEADFMPCVEIGWRLKKEFWHQGYATEGAKRVLQFAFEILELKEIVSFTSEKNLPSIAVMERIGLTYEKTFEHPKVKGTWLSSHVLYRCVTKL